MISNPLSMAVDFLTGKKVPVAPEPEKPETPEPGPLPIEDPRTQKILNDFFTSIYWSYVRDLIFREIIVYQTRADKKLQGALSDSRDVNGKMAAFYGGMIRGGEEIKLSLELLKKKFTQ